MGTPQKYKQTEIGSIPEDWNVKKIGEIGEIDSENLSSSTSDDYQFSYISIEDVDNGILRGKNEILFKNAPSRARRKIKLNDILISTVRPNLKSHLLIKNNVQNWICSTGFSVITCKANTIDSGFVFSHFFSSIINRQIENLISGSNYPAINSKDVRTLLIPLPPTKAEQTAIATALNDADALITQLEKLIAKKRLIKQGAMQELLRPKEGWVETTIGQYAKLINGRAYSLHEWETQGIPVIRLQNLTGNGENYYYSNLKLADKQYCEFGDLLFMWSATFGPIIWKGRRAIYHYHIWKIETDVNKLDKLFLFYILNDLTERIKKSSTNGGTMLHITKKSMENTFISLPSKAEQTQIAQTLSDMDAEIEGLEQKLDKYRKIKDGMMQNLLTGKIRLI